MNINIARYRGIVRRADDLGRVVLAKEYRDMLGIDQNTPLEQVMVVLPDGTQGILLVKTDGN